ncbi:MAG: hypothetical protein ABH950_06620 [Candidatus Altiarchaeota archaeon]
MRLIPLIGIIVSASVFLCYPPQSDTHPVFLEMPEIPCTRVNLIHDRICYRFTETVMETMDINPTNELLEFQINNVGRFYRDVKPYYHGRDPYREYNVEAINSFGLTDPILARLDIETKEPAHKWELVEYAEEIVEMRKLTPFRGKGLYRWNVDEGFAPKWVDKNLEKIEVIEKKTYNEHNFLENLNLAISHNSLKLEECIGPCLISESKRVSDNLKGADNPRIIDIFNMGYYNRREKAEHNFLCTAVCDESRKDFIYLQGGEIQFSMKVETNQPNNLTLTVLDAGACRTGDVIVNDRFVKRVEGNGTRGKIKESIPLPKEALTQPKIDVRIRHGNLECFGWDIYQAEIVTK